jgi:hypothetical protein
MSDALSAEATAQALATIAAQTAKFAGVDATITPCPEVIIQVGSPPQSLRCCGVLFDGEYLLALLPTAAKSRWRILKLDPATGSVVLRLKGFGRYRKQVVRILAALIYDRLKARRDQFEPQIDLLSPPADPVELRSVAHPPVYPAPRRKPKPSPDDSPRPVAGASVPAAPSASAPAAGPGLPAQSAAAPEPAAPAAPASASQPAKSAGPPAAPEEKARPLAGRVRR